MFSYISAGATYPAFGGISAFVKFKPRTGKFSQEEFPDGYLYRLKDREVFIIQPGVREYNHPIYFTDFDFAVDMDYLGINSACKNTGIMFIYENKESQRRHSYDKREFKHGKLFVDSGGFKLASGSESFIDPVDLATFHNKYANYGMTLDLPMVYSTKESLLLRHAEVQRLNTEVILDSLNKDVTLYNISHGFTNKMRRKYIDHVFRDDLTHWGVGASYYGNVFDFLGRVLTNIEHVGVNGESFHIFGVANSLVIPVLAWLGKYYDITSDASTPIQCARNLTAIELHGLALKKLRVGKVESAKLTLEDYPTPLSCSCNVCHAIGNNELFFSTNKTSGIHLLGIHNAYTLSTYSSLWNNLAQVSSLKEYKEQYRKILPKLEQKTWIASLDYIESFVEHGLDKSDKKFSSYKTSELGFAFTKGCPTNFSLFEKEDEDAYQGYANSDYMLEVLETYEDYHKNRLKKGVQNTKEIVKKKKTLTKKQLRNKKSSLKMGLSGSGKSKKKIKKAKKK